MNDIAEARDILGRRILPGNRVLFTRVGSSRLRIGGVIKVECSNWVLVSYNRKVDHGMPARFSTMMVYEGRCILVVDEPES